MRIQRASEHRAMPWANGRGTSYEVARVGGDDWAWRVAIAPVLEDGPFSVLPGVDRWLVVMDDAPLLLDVAGAEHLVGRGDVLAFGGDLTVSARLPNGPTRDCGLMVRRGRATGGMSVARAGAYRGRIVVAVESSVIRLSRGDVALDVGDALVAEDPSVFEVVGGSVCIVDADFAIAI